MPSRRCAALRGADRPEACPRAILSRQRAASTGHGTGACGHCAQCASRAPSGPAHPHRAGHRAPIAPMTTRAAWLAAGSPRHSPPQRGHCGCLVAQRAHHRWPPATATGEHKGVQKIWQLCYVGGRGFGWERRHADPCRRRRRRARCVGRRRSRARRAAAAQAPPMGSRHAARRIRTARPKKLKMLSCQPSKVGTTAMAPV